MRDLVVVLMLALVATCVAVPHRSSEMFMESSSVSLPQLHSVVGESTGGGLSTASVNPLTNWLVGQLWSAIYALEGIS